MKTEIEEREMQADVQILSRLVGALERIADNLPSVDAVEPETAKRIADALEELAAVGTHRLHDEAIRALQNHKSDSITKAIISKHPCRFVHASRH
jgi:hypothetical protein